MIIMTAHPLESLSIGVDQTVEKEDVGARRHLDGSDEEEEDWNEYIQLW